MTWIKVVRAEHAGWFGAGLSTAAVGVAAFQLLAGPALPGPQPHLVATSLPTPFPARFPTRTLFPTRTATSSRTPGPSRTPYPTRTPRPYPSPTPELVAPDLLATLTVADPDRVVAAVATFAARVSSELPTPRPR